MHKSIITLTAAAALLIPATAANAASVHFEGPEGSEVLVITGAPGERNIASIQDHTVAGAVTLYDGGVTWESKTPYCKVNYTSVTCPAPNGLRFETGDGDDWITVTSGITEPIHLVGGPGNDRLEGENGADRLDGGEGDDRLSGYGGDDALEGGAGNDVVDGYSGRDTVRGGDGDDTLHGDSYEAASGDVIDGGAGTDTIESDYSTRATGDAEPLLSFTLAGGADDGRPGEGDDVQNVERLVMSKGGTFVGTEAADYVKLHQVGDDGVLDGRGGDDELRGGDGRDRIDGGAGADKLDGGFGDDAITGGPGPDAISADLAGGDCGPLWCKQPVGNDTVEARDGETDSVSCGAGTDRVVADAQDVVAPDCETVERAGVPVPGTTGPRAKRANGTKGRKLVIPSARLRSVLRSGLPVRLSGFKAGRVKVTVKAGRRTVASRRVKIAAGRTTTTRLRFTRAARRQLAKRRSVALVVRAGTVSQRLTVKR